MSNEVTGASSPSANKTTFVDTDMDASPNSKGKGKAVDDSMEEDEEDVEEEDDDAGSGEEEDEEEEEEEFEEIDPQAILGRRTRGVKVDYTSKEALAKAGLNGNEDDEEDDDVEMK
ncbi:hypothetical protein BJ165DRAFT_1456721 [Panaeolus papilionaceus]|nr:hypothetical protein BJ165DRAFT_1456721 [Panaeolus papilionaceus]